MVPYGMTVSDKKSNLLSLIMASRQLMRGFSDIIKKYPESPHVDDYYRFIAHEQVLIKRNMAKLIELERWRIREGIEPDEKVRVYNKSAIRA